MENQPGTEAETSSTFDTNSITCPTMDRQWKTSQELKPRLPQHFIQTVLLALSWTMETNQELNPRLPQH
jgi:hypothetical protein